MDLLCIILWFKKQTICKCFPVGGPHIQVIVVVKREMRFDVVSRELPHSQLVPRLFIQYFSAGAGGWYTEHS